jgi:hypothetical protein
MGFNYAKYAAQAAREMAAKRRREERERARIARDEARHSRGSGNRLRDTTLQAGAAIIGVTGYMATPGQRPNTDQLGDVNDSQMESHRDSIDDKSHQQGTGTSQSK